MNVAVTTIEALNATGIVYAVQDGVSHVSVYPIGGTLALETSCKISCSQM